jgi:hypothetical protein
MVHLFIGMGLVVCAIAGAVVIAVSGGDEEAAGAVGGIFGGVGYIWGLIGYLHYRVRSYGLIASMMRLGRDITFKGIPSTGAVFGRVLGGSMLVGLALVIALVPFGIAAAGLAHGGDETVIIITMAVGYIVALSLANAVSTAAVVQPIIRHFVTSTAVMTPSGLSAVRQRAQDDFADADGFADALDVGAAL